LSELLELCAIFAVIYLLDCGVVVPRRAVGLVRFAGRWRAQRAFSPNASWSQGALFGNPLPPLSPPLIVEPLPLVIGPNGVTFEGPATAATEGRFVRWDDVGPVSAAGPRLEIAGRTVVLATRRGAASVAGALAGLQALEPAGRVQQLERLLDARCDSEQVNRRLADFRRETRLLALVTNLLWAALLVSLVALVRAPLVVILVPAMALVVAAWIAAPLLTERGLRRSAWLRPAWRPEPGKRVLAALTPLGAIRSLDLLARELFGDLDPLAVASVLLPARAFATMARPRLVQLRFGATAAPPGGEGDQAWWRQAMRARIERLLRGRGLDLDALVVAPPRDSQQVVAWCPSCLAQYDSSHLLKACGNTGCAGVSLVRYQGTGPQ
jgi:hypothetical protein